MITFNRSNGGATYVNRGIIVKKWSSAKYTNRKIISSISSDPMLQTARSTERSRLFLIISVAVIIGMVIIIRFISKALYKTVRHSVERIDEIGS